MKTNILLFVPVFLCLCLTSINAQTVIGHTSKPNKGAILDLKESDTSNSNNANSQKGLLLPRVNLTAADKVAIQGNSSNLTGQEAKHTGMTVYNLYDNTDDLCEGPYVWTGMKWARLWGDCNNCEYSIIGLDGNEYFFYCLDFTGTLDEAVARCKQSDVTNPDGKGGYHTYHLMTYWEFIETWPKQAKGTSEYKFFSGDNFLIHYPGEVNGWITLGKLYTEGTDIWAEAVGLARSKKTDTTAMARKYFSGGLPVGAKLSGTYTIRCVRDNYGSPQ